MCTRNLRLGYFGFVGLVLALIHADPAVATQSPAIDNEERSETRSDPAEDEEQSWRRFYASMGLGFDFSRGDYGEPEKTDFWSFPAFLKLEYEPITLKLSLPYVVIDGADEFVAGENDVVAGNGSSTRYGIGDAVASLTYSRFPSRDYVPILDLTVKVKIPTARTKEEIGTGETDVTFQFELTETIGPVSLFAGAGYRYKGGFYDDIWLTSVGTNVRLGRPVSVGAAYDFREGSTPTSGDSHEIATFASFRIGTHHRIGPYAVFGLSENAPDWGVGATFTYSF